MGKKTDCFLRFSTVAGERGAADAERDIRGFAMKFYTEEGNWDLVGNNTPVFFLRDPLKFPDLNHAVKRDPRTLALPRTRHAELRTYLSFRKKSFTRLIAQNSPHMVQTSSSPDFPCS